MLSVPVATKLWQFQQHVAQHTLANNFSRSTEAKFLFVAGNRYSPTQIYND